MLYETVMINHTADPSCTSGTDLFSEFMEINTQLTFALSVFPNLLVIYMAATTRIRELRQFRLIVAAQSINEILSSFVLSFFSISLKSERNMMITEIQSILLPLSVTICVILYYAYAFMLLLSIFLPLTIFLYRYAFICSNEMVKRIFTGKNITLWAFFTICFEAMIIWRYGSELEIYTAYPSSGVTMVTEFPYKQYDKAKAFLDVAHAAFFFVSVILAYAVVAYCAHKTFVHVNLSIMHVSAKRVQKQLNFVMMLQAITPLICSVAPIIVYCICVFARINIGCGATVFIMLFNWQPCAHPFISLYFVAPFRKRLLRYIKCCCFKRWVVKPATSSMLPDVTTRQGGIKIIRSLAAQETRIL